MSDALILYETHFTTPGKMISLKGGWLISFIICYSVYVFHGLSYSDLFPNCRWGNSRLLEQSEHTQYLPIKSTVVYGHSSWHLKTVTIVTSELSDHG